LPVKSDLTNKLCALVVASLACQSLANADTADMTILLIEQSKGTVLEKYTPDTIKTAFTMHVLETRTPWTKDGKAVRFRGPFLLDILAKNHLDSVKSIQAYAYNDFVTEIEISEIRQFSPILAMERQCTDEDRKIAKCSVGQDYVPLGVNDGGPYYLVWPMDQLPKSYVPTRNSIWVWFVATIRPAP
jgi:hypothetical protein